MELRDFRRGDLIRGPFPELRHEIAVQNRRVVGRCSRLALWLRMLADEEVDELRDRHRRICLRSLLSRVLSSGDSAENRLGLAARLVWRDRAVSPQHHEAPWTRQPGTARSIATDVGLGYAFRDPERKALQLRTPTDIAPTLWRGAIDSSLGQLGGRLGHFCAPDCCLW